MSDDAQVRDDPERSRYEIRLGGEVAGFMEYVLHGNEADFTHTEVDDKFEGQGVGSTLIGAALDDARGRGWQVLPYCPFVRKFVAKHGEYLDLVPAEQRERFGLPG